MADLPHHPSAEALLAHADWVRALARTLVRDPGGADDVAQESWLDALERPPRDARNLRGWLAQIVRNAARQKTRSELRRETRERATARPEALPDTAELVAHAELQREVVGHVLALTEPERTTVLLRYFQGLEAREIAERQRVPLATVRSRLHRALEHLRERLDRTHGERANWCAALVGLTGARDATATLLATSSVSIGGVFMAMVWKTGVAVLVIAAVWWAWTTAAHDEVTPRATLVASTTDAELGAAPTAPISDSPTDAVLAVDRAAVPAEAPSANSTSPEPVGPALKHVEGRVVDELGRPVGGLRVVAFEQASDGAAPTAPTGSRVYATTAADGSYSLDVPGRFIDVESADDAWIFTCEGQPIGHSEQVRVAVRALAIEGIVVDEAGAPLSDASIDASFSCNALQDFPFVLYGVESKTWSARSSSDGSFRLPALPARAEIRVTHDGHADARVLELDTYLRIVLRATKTSSRESVAIRGIVVDELGAPIAGASVRFGTSQSTSDEHGHFDIAVTNYADATPLTAAKPGLAAAVLERFGEVVRAAPASLDGTVLRMSGAALAISGRVLDADGRPSAGWWVDLADGTPSDSAAGTVERESASDAGAASPRATDADGRFRIDGLRDRSYRVRALDSTGCLSVISEPTAAGSDELVLRVPRDAVHPLLRGRVVSQRGRPIGGAVVRLMIPMGLLTSGELAIMPCRETQTDEQGRFELDRVPRAHSYLFVDGPHIESSESVAIPDSGEIVLRASVRCRFRVDVRTDDPADRFRVLDGDGKELRVAVQRPGGSEPGGSEPGASELDASVRRGDDGFPVCLVGDEAATLVLYRGEHELRRVPLELQPSELQIVTL